jgi:hypothetical protein
MSFRSKTLRDSAKDQACVLCGARGTTVAAHANSVALGKGTGIKAPDYHTAWLCQRCHFAVDAGPLSHAEKQELWTRAFVRTVAQWFEQGIVTVA